MRRLFSIGLSTIARIATIDRAAESAKNVAMMAVLYLVAGLLGVAAFACVMAALWIYSIDHVGPAGAPLIVAVVLAAGATIIIVVCARASERGRVSNTMRTAESMALEPHRMISAATTGFLLGLTGRSTRHG